MPKKGRTYGQDILAGEYDGIDGAGSIGKRFRPGRKTKLGEFKNGDDGEGAGTSIFDPVLCEMLYSWFCPPNGQILDPFAGGHVRGVMASLLGRRYLGIDLSDEQVKANRQAAETACAGMEIAGFPHWICGDSKEEILKIERKDFDFVFSCPPYFDLEEYSDDDPRDLSLMDWANFRGSYHFIINAAVNRLAPNRFACFVVGDIRDKKTGLYRNLPALTIDSFQSAGAALYNEAILVTSAGSLPMRAGKQFENSRKLGKTHQNILIFVKGDPVAATRAVGPCEFGDMTDPDNGGFEIDV